VGTWPYNYSPIDYETYVDETTVYIPIYPPTYRRGSTSLAAGLADEFGLPDRNAYEILAFLASSDEVALGQVAVDWFQNVNLEAVVNGYYNTYPASLSNDILKHYGRYHSYEFYFDAARTRAFYDLLIDTIG
jgi:hypothetical protein